MLVRIKHDIPNNRWYHMYKGRLMRVHHFPAHQNWYKSLDHTGRYVERNDFQLMEESNEIKSSVSPSHYHEGKIDVINFSAENFSDEQMEGFYKVSAIKYITRFGKKDGYNLVDLDKAIDYLNMLKELRGGNQS